MFQEEGWPPRIDDPLPPSRGRDHTYRLRNAVRHLNTGHKVRSLRFASDGTGTGVTWQVLSD